MIKYKKLDTEYDQVIVLDFLSDQERKDHQITSDLEKLFKANKFEIQPFYFSHSQEVKALFKDLIKKATIGNKYMLHFVAHGNEKGIGFKHTGEFISWVDLETYLVELNKASKNSLVLNLTSCFGLHGIKTVNPLSSDEPFYGLIGYTSKLKIPLSKQANSEFYTSVFNGLPFNEALKKLQVSTNDLGFQCITSQGYIHLKNKKD